MSDIVDDVVNEALEEFQSRLEIEEMKLQAALVLNMPGAIVEAFEAHDALVHEAYSVAFSKLMLCLARTNYPLVEWLYANSDEVEVTV